MADNPIPGPSRPKRPTIRDPKRLTEDEMLSLMFYSDSEEEPDQESDSDWSGAEDAERAIAENDDQPGQVVSDLEEGDPEQMEEEVPLETIVNWLENPPNLKKIPFTGRQELKVGIPGEGKPIDFFKLLADDEFFDLLISQTNDYAELVFLNDRNPGPHSRISRWKPVDKQEISRFLGLIFLMGIIQVPRLRDYWRTDRFYNLAFRNYMSRNRFLVVLRCLHFAHNPQEGEPRPADRLHKVRTLVDFFNHKMFAIYSPQKNLSIDESMLLWRGRLLFRQYIKNKKHKYGVKFYLLTESNGTIMKLQIYTGAADDMGGKGHAANVVLHLASDYLDKGYSIYMDNYYNSVRLARQLLNRMTYCTGTLRAGRKETPGDVSKAKLKVGESVQRYGGHVCVGKWKDKRDVLYITTEHGNTLQEVTSTSGNTKMKPTPIAEYNKYMSGIDLQDQIMAYYPSHRKTIRWYKKVGLHIIEMMLYNSFMLYNKFSSPKLSYLDYRHSVIESLLPDPTTSTTAKPTSDDLHLPSKCEVAESGRKLRKRCRWCSQQGIRKDSQYYCAKCPETPGLCLELCFESFHKNIAK
ncbi:unnamed protein product [Acanthoscelides obtectus]|uniref:PiggyBac transposable element-derived protein domain-containing protein n=1 Tax=Acanthoscelides obtectus TaxID=200917 RepID=A0A9P0Q9N7_ACAOB|nr:unnamed protein product [Acanthoscelides obtectus]CAK1669401.1 PiggyBac transposable element-derived protein 4 [Acanthoscelides obtectus]